LQCFNFIIISLKKTYSIKLPLITAERNNSLRRIQTLKQKYSQELNIIQNRIDTQQNQLNIIIPIFQTNNDKVEALQKQIEVLQIRNDTLHSKQSRLGKYRTKTERNRNLQKQVTEMSQSKQEEITKLTQMKNNINSLEENIKQQNKELEILKMKEQELILNIINLQNELTKSHEKRKEMKNELKDLQKQENDNNKNINKFQQEMEKYEREIKHSINYNIYEAYIECRRIVEKYQNENVNQNNLNGVYGPVIELFNCDSRYEQAIEACAKHKLFYWICDNDDTATILIQLLKKRKMWKSYSYAIKSYFRKTKTKTKTKINKRITKYS